MGDKLKRLPALSFVQLAIAHNAEDPIWTTRQLVRQRHTARNRNPLSQGTGRGVHTARLEPIRVARQACPVMIKRA
ncbi:hypothetical protein D3C78_1724530 [compost metagenome]